MAVASCPLTVRPREASCSSFCLGKDCNQVPPHPLRFCKANNPGASPRPGTWCAPVPQPSRWLSRPLQSAHLPLGLGAQGWRQSYSTGLAAAEQGEASPPWLRRAADPAVLPAPAPLPREDPRAPARPASLGNVPLSLSRALFPAIKSLVRLRGKGRTQCNVQNVYLWLK